MQKSFSQLKHFMPKEKEGDDIKKKGKNEREQENIKINEEENEDQNYENSIRTSVGWYPVFGLLFPSLFSFEYMISNLKQSHLSKEDILEFFLVMTGCTII